MRVTQIEPAQRDADRVAVWLDGRLALTCHASVWAAAGWVTGDDVGAEDVRRLTETDETQTLVERALRLLAARPRSRAELARRLARGTKARPAPAPAQIEAALARLAELELIDDRAFADFWVEQRDRFRPKGSQALRGELRGQGVARDEIEAVVAPDRDLERALDAGRRRAHQIAARKPDDPRAFRDQLGPFLVRRGFPYDIVREAVTRLWREISETDAPVGLEDQDDPSGAEE